MAVKIRLMRMGKKKQPSYRVVVADSRSPRDGRFIELIGRYDPRPDPSVVEIDSERALHWLHNGAQPTPQVRKLLEISGAWGRFQVASGRVHVVGAPPGPPAPKASPAAKAAPAPVLEAPGPAGVATKIVDEAVETEAGSAGEDIVLETEES